MRGAEENIFAVELSMLSPLARDGGVSPTHDPKSGPRGLWRIREFFRLLLPIVGGEGRGGEHLEHLECGVLVAGSTPRPSNYGFN